MVDIYTDVAFYNGKAAATVLALSDKDFIAYYTFVFDEVPNSTYGELCAILSGLKAMKLEKDETYVVKTDSSSALHFIVDHDAYHKSKECLRLATKILKEVKGFDVSFELVVGHMHGHSPNKVVDKASRYILRVLGEEEK